MDEQKISRNIHLLPNSTAVGVPAAVGHDGRDGVNGRLTYQVGSDSYRCEAWRQGP
jgi:hypothetical protein